MARDSTGSTTPEPTAPLPAITVRRSGGFAGHDDTVTFDPVGAWSATDRAGTKKSGSLNAAQLATIRALAADPRLAEAVQSRPPTRCRDAFTYRLTVGGTHVEFVDCPADPDQPTACVALVKAVVGSTISAPPTVGSTASTVKNADRSSAAPSPPS